MAKVTKNEPVMVVPPTTFTVELTEEEMATLVITLSRVAPYELVKYTQVTVPETEYFSAGLKKAAAILVKGGNENIGHPLYDTFVAQFNE